MNAERLEVTLFVCSHCGGSLFVDPVAPGAPATCARGCGKILSLKVALDDLGPLYSGAKPD